jgi:hypothetical protein
MTIQMPKLTPFIFPDSEALIDAYCQEMRSNQNGLTRNQKNVLREYGYHNGQGGTAEDAAFRIINRYIRDLVADSQITAGKEHQKIAKTIYGILAKHSRPIKVIPLYRGTRTIPQLFAAVSVGDIVAMDQFVSMTNNPLVANSFCDPNGAMLIIRNAFGIQPDNSLECEYLGQAGSHFRIDNIYTQDWFSHGLEHNDVTVFEVTMLDTFTPIPHLKANSFQFKFW